MLSSFKTFSRVIQAGATQRLQFWSRSASNLVGTSGSRASSSPVLPPAALMACRVPSFWSRPASSYAGTSSGSSSYSQVPPPPILMSSRFPPPPYLTSSPLETPSWMDNIGAWSLMNRNARRPKNANRGKRAVSRVARREKKRALGNHRR